MLARLVAAGLEGREARWLIEEFGASGDALDGAIARRLAGEPLQYVIGHWPFRGLDLDVDARALIPRPETEELVGRAIEVLATSDSPAPVVLDLGCGTGAIGLSILAELAERGVSATLIAVDESRDALALCRQNAIKHRLYAVSFVVGSWYEGLDDSLAGRVDLVVSNPPYVGEIERASLDPVLDYEPSGALVAPDADGVAGFADLAAVIAGAPRWLTRGGSLVVEHGDGQREAVRRAAFGAGLRDVVDYDDLVGRPRVLVARQP